MTERTPREELMVTTHEEYVAALIARIAELTAERDAVGRNLADEHATHVLTLRRAEMAEREAAASAKDAAQVRKDTLEEAAKMVERKLFMYADVARCAAAIRALAPKP